MTEQHEPRPEFLEHLEWQIRTETRRQRRFAAGEIPWWRRGALRTAALVIVSLLVGFAGATAAQEGSERRALELLERQSQLQLQMAELELGLAADRLVWLESLVAEGNASERQLGLARWQREMMEREVTRARLSLEELQASGRPARNDLAAPLVNGRDLVSERLELRLEDLQTQLTVVTFQFEQVAGLVEQGRADRLDRERLDLEQSRVLREIEHVQRTLELRERFLDGAIGESDARSRQDLLVAQRDVTLARQQVAHASYQIEQAERTDGFSEMDRSAAETELRMAEVQLEIAETRLRYLRQQNRSRE